MWSFLTTNYEAIVAVSAVLVSAMALYVSIRALAVQRLHNRLTVKPAAKITLWDYEDNLAVLLENRGLGPMIVTDRSVHAPDGAEYKHLIHAMPALPEGILWDHFYHLGRGEILRAGDRVVLLQITSGNGLNHVEDLKENLRRALAKLTVTVKTKNLYGETMPDCKQSLGYFARRLTYSSGSSADEN